LSTIRSTASQPSIAAQAALNVVSSTTEALLPAARAEPP
jgi:hypothetical protein